MQTGGYLPAVFTDNWCNYNTGKTKIILSVFFTIKINVFTLAK
jgi:hypothetical protein